MGIQIAFLFLATLAFFYWLYLLRRCIRYKLPKDYTPCYELSREFVRHEDTLIDQRITWLLTIQGLLFAALGVLLSEKGAVPPVVAENFVHVLSFLGLLITIASTTTLFAGLQAVIHHSGHESDKPQHQTVGYKIPRWMEFLTPTVLYPLIFILAWSFVSVLF